MPEADNRPRVFCVMPSSGAARPEAALQSHLMATRGACVPMPGHVTSPSLMCWGFNKAFAQALNFRAQGVITHFCLHHDDIEIRTPGWLDVMLEEMDRVQAAVLSVVVPLKGEGGETSTAIEMRDFWNPKKLTLKECAEFPTTFSCREYDTMYLDRPLLINSGLLLIDLQRPEFTACDPGGVSKFFFSIRDRIARTPEGEWIAHVASEDWNFSRQCHAAGLPVYATRAIHVIHHGGGEWSNQPEEK